MYQSECRKDCQHLVNKRCRIGVACQNRISRERPICIYYSQKIDPVQKMNENLWYYFTAE